MSEVIVVTSGKGGVGKTTTTANIGIALAMLDYSVLLIDTDIGLRNLDVVMGLENRIVYNLVDVVEGKHIDEPQYAVLRHEVARHIQMGSAVTEAWVVRNLHGGHADALGFSCGCNGLAQGLDAVEDTCSTGSLNADAVSRHAEAVCLGILVLEVSREKDSRHTSFGFGGLFELQTSGLC